MPNEVYYVIYAYGVTSATTTEAQANITSFVGAFRQDDDHIKFDSGIYRYEAGTNVVPIAGDYAMTTFDKGTWPPPPGRAKQVFHKTDQELHDLITAGAALPADEHVALFIYEDTRFRRDERISITACIDGNAPGPGSSIALTRGVYRLPAFVGDIPSGLLMPAEIDSRDSQRQAPSFDSITFQTRSFPRLTPAAIHAFGSAKSIHDKLVSDLPARVARAKRPS